MAQAPLTTTVRYLRRLTDTLGTAERSDEQLLSDFIRDHDEPAFAALVRRYAALVTGVCRRTLRHHQDTEDAFQATFLVLAQSAASIRRSESLAAWLYGVAHRVAMKAKRSQARRRPKEQQTARTLAVLPSDELSWREVQAVLDEEVQRLPEHYRRVFIECCLHEQSKPEAARRLGLKEGTVSSRLAKAKRLLQARLSRRGVTLSALLTATGVASEGARVSAVTVETTAHAAAQVAAGAPALHVVPVHVVTLAQGVTRAMLFTKAKIATALLLFVVVVGGSGLLLAPLAAQPERSEPQAEQKPAIPAKDEQAEPVEVKGRVLDPDSKPVAGAKLFLASRTEPTATGRRQIATTDVGGRFQMTLAPAELEKDGVLVATADGLGPDWVGTRGLKAKEELTLRLAKDDLPVSGRLLDLEGRPVAGATVDVRWVGKKPEDDLGAWIDHFVARHAKGYWINEEGLHITRAAALGVAASVTTDKDGRFQLTGWGRDRVATVVVRSEMAVSVRLQVATRQGPENGWVKGNHGLYPTRFDFLMSPCKPIVGTVRDKKTGKPIAGVTVGHSHWPAEATTDAQGRFRLLGAPKQQNHIIALGGRKGVPYIDWTQHDIPDTPGLDPLEVNFELERGVEITGKVLDETTGKPVRGSVQYFRTRDNPFAKDYTTLEGAKLIVSRWGEIQPDGTFSVLGIPGPGVLVVSAADSARYPRINNRKDLHKFGVDSWPAAPTHRAVPIDPREENPGSLTCDITLVPGAVCQGTVTDADGNPLPGTRVVGLADSRSSQKLDGSSFTATGLQRERERALVFYHADKKLGGVAGVSAQAANPFAVKLQPLGSLAGRLVDADGKPLPDRRVIVRLSLDPQKYENLPDEMHHLDGVFSIHHGSWRDFTGRATTTDKEGRFRVDGLIPGERYDLYAGPGDIERQGNVSHRELKLTVSPGREKDLRDVKPKPRAKE